MPLLNYRDLPKRRIVSRPGVGTTSHLRQARSLFHAGVALDAPSFILVRSGLKRFGWSAGNLIAEAGDIIVVPGGAIANINNDPVDDPCYEAFSIILDDLSEAAEPAVRTRPLEAPLLFKSAAAGFVDALERAQQAIVAGDSLPDGVARHRIAELLHWLEAAGFHLPRRLPRTTAMAIRAIARVDLARAWAAGEMARRLAMSEATMRRKLAGEGTSFTEVVIDLRLSQALALLQATDEPISMIALAVGYESQSSFASRFRQRFGHAPSAVRHRGQAAAVAL